MQAIGFGSLNGLPYVLIRNQWGPIWGEGGYIYVYLMKNSESGVCGVYFEMFSATVGF